MALSLSDVCTLEQSYHTSDSYRVLSLVQISRNALFIDMFKYGRIVSIDTLETLADFGNDGFRCVCPIQIKKPDGNEMTLLLCGMEHSTLELWEVTGLDESPPTAVSC